MAPKPLAHRSIGILFSKDVKVPVLGEGEFSLIDTKDVLTITRHFREVDLDRTLRGSFKFGTIARYRPADAAQVGRFSDFQEGLQCEIFASQDEQYNNQIRGVRFSNVAVSGFTDPITVEHSITDYCSCSSIGGFSEARAKLIRDRGNPELSAYAVYDVDKLRQAIEDFLSEDDSRRHLRIIARKVEYGSKDRRWLIDGNKPSRSDRDDLTIWIKNAFVKSLDYNHEDEMRILLVDPENAGRLADKAEAIILNDPRIAQAITTYGRF